MAIFIPKNNLHGDKKPDGAEYNFNSNLAHIFDAYYVFDSLSPNDLVGLGGRLSNVTNPQDNGTSKLTNELDYGVKVSNTDITNTSSSSKFLASTSNFWTTSFNKATFYFNGTLDAIIGGPMVVFSIGGAANGLEISYRTSPRKLSVICANSSSIYELQHPTVINPSVSEKIQILATFDNGFISIYTKVAGVVTKTTGNATYSSIPNHTSLPGFFGVDGNSPSSVGSVSNSDGWTGKGYALGVSTCYSASDLEVRNLFSKPYQLLKPNKKYFALGAAATLPPVNLTLTNALSSSTAQSVPVQQSNNLSLSSAVSASNASSIAVSIASTINLSLANSNAATNAQSIAAQQSNNLVLSNSLSSSNASTINEVQTNNLILSNSTSSTNTSSIAVSVINPVNLSLANSVSASSSGAVSINQTNNLTLSNGLSSSSAATITVSVIPPIYLSLSNANSTTNAGALLIGQTNNLALSSAVSATNASSVAASVINGSLLSLSNASSQSSASTISIAQSNNLSLSGATSASSAAGINAVQGVNLSLSNSVSNTSASAIIAAQVPPINLSLSNSTSSSSASSLSVQQSINLLLSSAQSSSLADTITATQAHILWLSNAISTSYAKGINALGVGLGVIMNPSIKIVSTIYNVKSTTIIRSIKNG